MIQKRHLDKRLIIRPKNDIVRQSNIDFMRDSTNQCMAEFILQSRIDENLFNCQEEFIEYARRRGYMKTEMDRKIVEHLLQKNNNLKSNEMEYIKTKQGEWLRKKRIRAIVESATKNNPEVGDALKRILREEYKIL